MKSIPQFWLIALLFTADEAFKKLAAIAGLWRMETEKGSLYEEWKIINECKLIGKSYKVTGADTITLENVLLHLIDTSVYYIPTVTGQNKNRPVTFKMISYSGNSYIFENKRHDFPQRVIYQFINTDSLVATIEGTVNGAPKFSDFYYSRIKQRRLQ